MTRPRALRAWAFGRQMAAYRPCAIFAIASMRPRMSSLRPCQRDRIRALSPSAGEWQRSGQHVDLQVLLGIVPSFGGLVELIALPGARCFGLASGVLQRKLALLQPAPMELVRFQSSSSSAAGSCQSGCSHEFDNTGQHAEWVRR